MQPNTDRLVRTISMMDRTSSCGDAEAESAFRMATKMLAEHGLTWTEIARRALGPTASATTTTELAKAQGFGDIFAGIFGETFAGATHGQSGFASPFFTPQGDRRPAAAPRSEVFTGAAVPREVAGRVQIIDADRRSRNGPMLVVQLVAGRPEYGEQRYGPLVCFDADAIAALKTATEEGRSVIATVRPARIDSHMPTIVRVQDLD